MSISKVILARDVLGGDSVRRQVSMYHAQSLDVHIESRGLFTLVRQNAVMSKNNGVDAVYQRRRACALPIAGH